MTTGVRTSHEVVLREEAPGSRVIPATFSRQSLSGSGIAIAWALVFCARVVRCDRFLLISNKAVNRGD